MKGLLNLIGTSSAGWLGWWLCDGANVMIQYGVSVIAAGVGFFYTRKFVENLLGS